MDTNAFWQLVGNAAEHYESTLVPVIFIPWAEHLLTRAGLQPGHRVLDVACGTGIVARMAASQVGPQGHVAGVDLNGGMLAVARQQSQDARIEWIKADAARIPLENQSFDVVFCQQGLQFFPDRPSALAEFRRVLKGGGRAHVCVAADIAENPLIQSQAAAFDKHLGSEAANAIRAVCGLTDPKTLEGLFRDAGFAEASVERVSLTLTHPDGRAFVNGALAATPVAGAFAAMPQDKREAVVEDILAGFGACFDGGKLAFPHVSNVVSART